MNNIEKQAQANDCDIPRVVYGAVHYEEEHVESYYKPRFLRRVLDNGNVILAYPDGLPGGFSLQNRIHFVGHSQGAQTIRYL